MFFINEVRGNTRNTPITRCSFAELTALTEAVAAGKHRNDLRCLKSSRLSEVVFGIALIASALVANAASN